MKLDTFSNVLSRVNNMLPITEATKLQKKFWRLIIARHYDPIKLRIAPQTSQISMCFAIATEIIEDICR